MNLENIYNMAKSIDTVIGKDIKSEMIVFLPKVQHEDLQQEVYKFNKKTLQDYKSETIYQVVFYNTRYIFKIAP